MSTAIVKHSGRASYTEAENLARSILARMDSVAAKLKTLEDDVRRLWMEFDKLKPGETILGCATKKEFCETKLHRTPRAVRYMLEGGNPNNDNVRYLKPGEIISPQPEIHDAHPESIYNQDSFTVFSVDVETYTQHPLSQSHLRGVDKGDGGKRSCFAYGKPGFQTSDEILALAVMRQEDEEFRLSRLIVDSRLAPERQIEIGRRLVRHMMETYPNGWHSSTNKYEEAPHYHEFYCVDGIKQGAETQVRLPQCLEGISIPLEQWKTDDGCTAFLRANPEWQEVLAANARQCGRQIGSGGNHDINAVSHKIRTEISQAARALRTCRPVTQTRYTFEPAKSDVEPAQVSEERPPSSNRERKREAFKSEFPEYVGKSNREVDKAIRKANYALPVTTKPEPATSEPVDYRAVVSNALDKWIRKHVLEMYGYYGAKFATYPQQHPLELNLIESQVLQAYKTIKSICEEKLQAAQPAPKPKPRRKKTSGRKKS
jgi:hypothetical protein